MKKKIGPILIVICLIVCLFGCGNKETPKKESEKGETRVIKDAVGREVEIPKEVRSVIPMANGLRMMVYANAMDLVTGVELGEKNPNIVKAYNWVNQERLKNLPVIGEGGGGGYAPYEEEIVKVNPDVIICAYSKEDGENLQEKTGIPVVIINGGTLFEEDYKESLRIVGEVCNREARCKEVIAYIDEVKADLQNRTKEIKEGEKPLVYAGAVSFSGGHGIEGSYKNFPPFKVLNVKDIFEEKEETAKGAIIEKEKILTANPDIIFLDPNNMPLVNEDYKTNKEFYQSLQAVKNNQLYSMLGYNYYYTNVEIALANCYYSGSIIYPEKFKDVDPVEKAKEIFGFMIGSDTYYEELLEIGFGFSKITLGE